MCASLVTGIYNKFTIVPNFPSNLKYADINPAHKKGDYTDKDNYRPVSLLPVAPKVFERLIHKDISSFMEKHLSNRLCGFRKGHSAQLTLIVMLEEMRKHLDKGNACGMILTDLSKAFDCIKHDLLIAKLNAYGFDHSALALINSYFSGREQRTKIGTDFSNWAEIILGAAQGSIIGPLAFNIYINDIFIFTEETEITNFADDNTPFACDTTVDLVIGRLEKDLGNLLQWFKLNYFKPNLEKSHLLLNNSSSNLYIKVCGKMISNSKNEKLLGITIDSALNFDTHVNNLCKKANQKFHVLARLSNYMDKDKLRLIMKAFITSQFSYCPLVWMFHSRGLNERINKIHEKSLRLVYNDNISSFDELLVKDNCATIHDRNLQVLATEIFKATNDISPTIMKNIFDVKRTTYNLRSGPTLLTSNIKTVKYGMESLSYRGPKTWNLVPLSIRNSKTFSEFKSRISLETCRMRL